jgi:hypothetical protein
MSLTRAGSLDPGGGRSCALCHRSSGGQRLSMEDYVTGLRGRTGRLPPEGASVGYAPKLRRAGKQEPSWLSGPVSRQDLSRLGVTSNEIDAEISKAAVTWASVMQRAGYQEAAASLAKQAWRHGRGSVWAREAVGSFYLALARSSMLHGKRFHGLASALRALGCQPTLLWRMLRGALRRLT